MSSVSTPSGDQMEASAVVRPARPPRGFARATLAVGGLAFLLRAVWVMVFVRLPSGLSDPFLYHGYGLRIAAGRGYRSLVEDLTAYYPPGYPYFLGGLYRLADSVGLDDHLDLVVGLTQSMLWAVAAMAVVLTGRWTFGPRRGMTAGIGAGLILACWPNLVTYAGAWLSESLFVALFAVAVAALSFAARSEPAAAARRGALVVAALTIGAATMVRPQVLLGLPLVAAAWLLGGLGWKRTLALAGAISVGVAAFVVPWALRNDGVFGEPVLVSTNGGDNLCIGFHPGARGSFHHLPPYCDTGEFWNDGREAELRRNDETRELALQFMADEPLALPWLSVRKLYYTYRSDDDGLVANESYGAAEILPSPWRGIWLSVTHVAYGVILVAAVAGLVLTVSNAWRGRRRAAELSLVGLTVAGILVPMLFFGDPRFKVPNVALFAVFAGLAVATALDRRRERAA